MRYWLLCLAAIISAGGGCAGAECDVATDCGPAGDALCLDGRCRLYAEGEFVSAVVDISFPRDIPNVPKSGRIFFLHPQLANGGALSCSALFASPQLVAEPKTNHLLLEPRFLVFNCCGTFYPDNLVQFIRPAEGAIAFAEGFASADGTGPASTRGCTEGISLTAGMQSDVLLAMSPTQ